MQKKNTPENEKTFDAGSIIKAIRELESPKAKRERERATLFSELYLAVRDQLNAGVSRSAIVGMLIDHRVSISTRVFDQLLKDEAKRRGEPVPGKASDVGQDLPAGKPTNVPHVVALKVEDR